MKLDIVVITDESTRADLIAAIDVFRAKRDRLPVHYTDQRAEYDDAVADLVERIVLMDMATDG